MSEEREVSKEEFEDAIYGLERAYRIQWGDNPSIDTIRLYLDQEKRMAFEGGREHAKNGRGVGLILKTTALRFADFEDYEAWRKE